jgi:uncharacterized protein YjbI with pentapeptide repeats
MRTILKAKRLKDWIQRPRRAFKIPHWIYWVFLVGAFIPLVRLVYHWQFQVFQDWETLQHDPKATSEKKFDASLEIAKAIVGGVGTLATVSGGFLVLWNIRLTQTRLITERFSNAVEQLGNDKIEVRLGGIYALERIAQDSDRDHWIIMEVLTSFIQEKSSIKRISEEQVRAKAYERWKKGSVKTDKENWNSASEILLEELMTKDIQAALTVIGRRYKKDELGKRIDLSGANLIRALLNGANLSHALLTKSDLNNAFLTESDLNGASFFMSNLRDAHLNGANLVGANLTKANLSSAHLRMSNLNGAALNGAILSNANLNGATLINAHLSGANLNGANLNGANLNGAIFSGVDLSRAKGLTTAQLTVAKICHTTLPQEITLSSNRDCKVLGLPEI